MRRSRSNGGGRNPPGDLISAQQRRERLRRRYRPERVRLLFVGEAPPASGRFFYQRDSGLYRAIRDAFRAVNPSISDASFLPLFQAAGCYLLDVCPHPVDHLDKQSRREACRANEAMLGRHIKELQPPIIVTMLRSLGGVVDRAAIRAHWHGQRIDVPYPGRWWRHRVVFVRKLMPTLRTIAGRRPPHDRSTRLL